MITRLPLLLVLLLSFALGGCASGGGTRASADSAAVASVDATAGVDAAGGDVVADVDADTAAVATTADVADVERSASPSPEQLDPWQSFNRRMHAVNSVLDKGLLRPVARVYSKLTPQPVRKGVTNFFGNLQQPVTTLNLVLQGRPRAAGESVGRFLLNLTLGLGGILDPATHAEIPYHDKDFGQTFARWGWHTSRYLVLPVFGPGTVRDTWGKGVATTVSPVSWLADKEGAEFSILYGIDARAGALPADAFLEGAEDEYVLIRDAYLQRRRCQIVDCSEEVPDYLLPDYDFEVPDFESMRR